MEKTVKIYQWVYNQFGKEPTIDKKIIEAVEKPKTYKAVNTNSYFANYSKLLKKSSLDKVDTTSHNYPYFSLVDDDLVAIDAIKKYKLRVLEKKKLLLETHLDEVSNNIKKFSEKDFTVRSV